MYEIRRYLAPDGKDLFKEWQYRLRDVRVRIAVNRRVSRMELGNFGDHKYCQDGVWELRIDFGPGIRVYYALAGARVVLLLGGGDKGSQRADIERACECWKEWQGREADEGSIA